MVPASFVALVLTTLWLSGYGSEGVSTAVVPLAAGGIVACAGIGACIKGWLPGARAALLAGIAVLPPAWCAVVAAALLQDRWTAVPPTAELLVTGSVCEFPKKQAGLIRFVLEADADSRARGAPRRILVSWYDNAAVPGVAPQPGEIWRILLRLRPPRGSSNPGGFDFERWLFSQRIGATGWVRPTESNGRQPGAAAGCRLGGMRAMLARRIADELGTREATPYVLGLAVGAYQALPETEWERLRRTGTVHLVSISGFHIALVAGPCALLGFLLGRSLLAFGWRCRPRVWAAWTVVGAGTLYGQLAGMSVPTVRSLLALIILALVVSAKRAVLPGPLLAAVLVGVLLVEPLAPLLPGFWLSFGGVAILGLVMFWSRTAQLPGPGPRPGLHRYVVQPLWALILTQMAMTIGLAPLLILFFGQLPASGGLANFVAIPAFSLVLLPLTLLGAAIASMDVPAFAAPMLQLAADCFDVWRTFVAWCAALPFAVWQFPAPALPALALAFLGVVWTLWIPPWPARALGPVLLVGLLGAAAAPVPPGGLRLTVLDVGQGLAVLLQTSGHTLLYDTGPAFRNGDAGARVVVPVLQALGIRHLDTVLISHGDADHAGGARAVLARFPAVRLVGAAPNGASGEACQAGMHWHWDGFDFDMVHPDRDHAVGSDNASSCVLRITGADASLLLTGDIEAVTERQLVEQGAIGPVDLVIAPHHGSRSSSSAELVETTRPRYVIFATGFANRWKFPAPEVAERWRSAGACLLNTAEEGAIQFDVAPGSPIRLTRRHRASDSSVWVMRPARSPGCA